MRDGRVMDVARACREAGEAVRKRLLRELRGLPEGLERAVRGALAWISRAGRSEDGEAGRWWD